MSIDELYKPISKYLEEFNTYYKNQLKSNVPLLNIIIRYLTRKKGKLVRPALVFFCADLCDKVSERSYIGATMVELLHRATLIHDDVVDEADKRRGIATVNSAWNNKIAVLVGDYFLAKGLLSAISNGEYKFLDATSRAVKRMSEGELLQIQKSKELDITEKTYFEIISNKTASLISVACEIGAISADATSEQIEALKNYGEYLGIAFQLKDDIFDVHGKKSIIGKPVGNDIKEKKITLPLIFALRQASKKENKEIISLLKKGKITQADIKKIINFINSYNGIEYAETTAKKEIEKAIECLSIFPNNEKKESLIKFTNFVVNRNK